MKKMSKMGESELAGHDEKRMSLTLRLFRTITRGVSGRNLGLHRIGWISRLHEAISKKLVPKGIVLTEIDGQKLYVKADASHIANSLLTLGAWEKRETDVFLSLIKPHMTVVDVGAHIGYYTLLAAKRVKQVYSFEPDPETFDLLKRSVNANGHMNVSCFQKAVSDKTGSSSFHVDSEAWANSLCSENVGKPVKLIDVETVRLDDLYSAGTFGQCVHVLKIDAQGAEALVLRGAETLLSQCRPIILLEVEPARLRNMGTDPSQLLNRLVHHYELRAIEARELSSLGAILALADSESVINVVAIPR
jgi:FkbM family methyltransferase